MIQYLINQWQFNQGMEICSAIGVSLFTFLEAWLFYQQNKIIWQKKSAESISVDLFIFLPFMFISMIIYGLSRGEIMLAVNGFLFLFVAPITIGLIKINGFRFRYVIWACLSFAGLIFMIVLPQKYIFYLFFSAISVIFMIGQFFLLWRNKSPGVIKVGLITVYLTGSILWVCYALSVTDWFLFGVSLSLCVVLGAIIILWIYYRHLLVFENIFSLIRKQRINIWGMSAHIDLHGCRYSLTRDPVALEKFVINLCALIKMRRRGSVDIDRFGEGDKEGYSAIQKIYDSAVSTITPLEVHLEEIENRVFIDVFSCKRFDPKEAEKFSQNFFQAEESNMIVLFRG